MELWFVDNLGKNCLRLIGVSTSYTFNIFVVKNSKIEVYTLTQFTIVIPAMVIEN